MPKLPVLVGCTEMYQVLLTNMFFCIFGFARNSGVDINYCQEKKKSCQECKEISKLFPK